MVKETMLFDQPDGTYIIQMKNSLSQDRDSMLKPDDSGITKLSLNKIVKRH